jgi:hypothetical protein
MNPERHRCEELTARRGLQCLRQAVHLVDAGKKSERFMCQQHWDMYMQAQGYGLS